MNLKVNYIMSVKSLNKLDKSMKKYVYKNDKDIYISKYEKIDDKNYKIHIRNMNILTGNEYYDEFIVPISNIKSIEEIVQ